MPESDGRLEDLSEGQVFAGYTIIRRLGTGGMGQVYLAQHPRLPRRDALKILPSELTANDEFRQRFNREADLAASLYNEHIVGIHDRGEYEGQLWISMDYVEGTDAAKLLRDQYPSGMPKADVVEIISAVADALDYAHSRGLLHRDVKPANILLTDASPRRRILLADFGIARELGDISGLTATNMLVGTTAYCAPEQLQGFGSGRASRPIRARLHRVRPADRVGAVSPLQPGGGHHPASVRATAAHQRAPTRTGRPRRRPCQGARQETRRPLPDVRRFRGGTA